MQNNQYITVEANMGAGKTTFCKKFNEILNKIQPTKLYLEPIKKQNFKTLLTNFYKNPKKWGFVFEIYTLQERINTSQIIQQSLQSHNIIQDRSLLANICFSNATKKSGIITNLEHKIINQLYETITQITQKPHHVIYLKVDPKTCKERIIKRARKSEIKISQQYLNKLHYEHEKLIEKLSQNHKITTITNSPLTEQEIIDNTQEIINQIQTNASQTNKNLDPTYKILTN